MTTTYYQTVIDVLTDVPITRDSDRLLLEHVYARLGIDISAPWYVVNRCESFPTLESIGRLRRKAQTLHEDLKPQKVVEENRKREENQWKEFARHFGE